MTKDRETSAASRKQGEAHLRAARSKPGAGPAGTEDLQRVLHELEVYRTELEVQNEELRAARVEQEATLARYTELFDFAPIGYATLSAEGIVREVNHVGARLIGKPRHGIVGVLFARFVAPDSLPAFHALVRGAEVGDAQPRCELDLDRRDRCIPVRLTATLIARAGRTILLAFEDISELLEREHQLACTDRALREANRRKDEFLGMLSHELRNPLGPISGSLFILDHVDPAGPQARDARAIIERQVTHLTRLVDDLLDVTRIARGKIELARERVELAELVQRTVEDHRAGFEAHEIRLETRLGTAPLWLDADPTRLVQIASNLLGNAQKFTPPGGSVVVSLEARGEQVALRVRDTGVGIAPALIGGLFEPFAQAPQSLDRSRGGLGLGLTTVKGLAELHGGTVRIESGGPGCGTEVVVTLPLASAPAEAGQAAEGAAGTARAVPAPRRRVLLIEDNPDVTAALTAALRLMGHDVRATDRGADGLALARASRPETVICDLGLPEMNGYAVAEAFRADPALREVQLIALSGYARPEDRQRSAAAGFDHHMAKPPDLQRLGRLISEGARAEISSPSPHRAATAGGRATASS